MEIWKSLLEPRKNFYDCEFHKEEVGFAFQTDSNSDSKFKMK